MESFCAKLPRERVYELTGIQFLPFNTLFQLEAMVRDKSPLLDIATDLLFIPDLLTYLLTGIKKTEFTFATTSQLFNPIKNNWEDEIFAALGLPKDMMQDVVLPGDRLGETTSEIAEEVRLGGSGRGSELGLHQLRNVVADGGGNQESNHKRRVAATELHQRRRGGGDIQVSQEHCRALAARRMSQIVGK